MNQMRDIDDLELSKVMGQSRPSVNSSQASDEALIRAVQNIKEGKGIRVDENGQTIANKLVEPEPMVQTRQTVETGDNSSNYWKIDGMPSKGKFYPSGSQIVGRPLKVLEIKKISSMNEENGDFILNDIIKRTIKGINHEDIYVADKLFFIFWLRANSYRDSAYVVPFTCNKCDKKTDYHFEVNNLEVKQVSDKFSPKVEYRVGNESITYDYLRIKDEMYIDRFKELNTEAMGNIDNEFLSMAQMIKTIGGKEPTLLQKYYWLIELDPGSFTYLKTLIEKNGMGIKPYVNVSCKECGGTAVAAVSFREEFLFPEAKFE